MSELAPADADMFWRSRHRTNDQFLLYCFAAQPDSARSAGAPRRLLDELRQSAETIDDLHLRVAPAPGDLAFPRWCAAPVDDDAFVFHPGAGTWDRCRDAVADLLPQGLDATVRPWRVHLFGPMTGAPRAPGPAWAVVFQVSHALGDGRRASALARALLGGGPVAAGDRPAPRPPGRLAALGGAVQIPARVAAGVGLGLLAWGGDGSDRSGSGSGPGPVPATTLNRAAGPRRRVDVLVVDADALRNAVPGTVGAPRPSVTVAFLTLLADVLADGLGTSPPDLAVELTIGHPVGWLSESLSRRLRESPFRRLSESSFRRLSERSESKPPSSESPVRQLSEPLFRWLSEPLFRWLSEPLFRWLSEPLFRWLSERSESKPPSQEQSPAKARNDFHNAGIRLRPDLDLPDRAAAVAAEIAAARAGGRRTGSAAWAQRRAAEITPPVLRALAARLSATGDAPSYVAGATVVSSVNRGPDDLRLAGGEVLFTAGFPALSAVHAMTIGVHGLGSTVTVSVTSDPDAVPAAESVVRLLSAALSP